MEVAGSPEVSYPSFPLDSDGMDSTADSRPQRPSKETLDDKVGPTASSPEPRSGSRRRRITRENMLDPQNLLLGLDEQGTRIRIFTANLTGEHALKAGVGKFEYTGEMAEPGGTNVTTGTCGSEVALKLNDRMKLNNGLVRHGHGEIKYDSGSHYVGQWKDDKREGHGTFTFACGDVYEGEFKLGQYSGKGTYTSIDSDGHALQYSGEWVADKMEGHGKYTYKSTGDVYEGGCVNGFREGFGKLVCANGDVFIGEYTGGEMQSKTRLDRANMQAGTDENGLRIRLFTATATGERALKAGLGKFLYTGETIQRAEASEGGAVSGAVGSGGEHGGAQAKTQKVFQSPGERSRLSSGRVRHGHGEITYDSGSYYVGQWQLDTREGTGKFTFACGDVYDGEWKLGEYSGKGSYTSADSDEYVGDWAGDKMHGVGRFVYRDLGDVYEGQFVDGVRHGVGTYTCQASGEVYEGEYAHGELVKKNGVLIKMRSIDDDAHQGDRLMMMLIKQID